MSDRLPKMHTRLQVTLHWVIAAIVLFQLYFGGRMSETMELVEHRYHVSLYLYFWYKAHYYIGIAILGLATIQLIVRLVWGIPPVQHGWMRIATTISDAAFYVIVIAMPILGLLAFYRGSPFAELHGFCAPLLVALIAIHFVAALYRQLWLKDGTRPEKA